MSSDPREYLIRKDGYYYRPNCSGYTTSKFEAGRYTKAEAERAAAVEPWHMSAIHQDDVEDDPVSSRVRMDTARIEALEAENAELRKKLSGCQWYWPEDDTSSEACADSPQEVVQNIYDWSHPEKPSVIAVARGGVVEVTYCATLPPADDADSDDDFWIEAETEEAAQALIDAEIARRAREGGRNA